MLKTFDNHGRILVLRPEFTTPIARLAASKLRGEALPLRLCYLGTAYANPSPKGARQRAEFTQAGVELMGCDGAQADAEVVMLALESMRASGLADYMVEIGQVDFFKGLMEEAGLDEETTELVRTYVEEKNMLAIELLLRGNGAAEAAIARIRELPMLFGGREVFARAEKLSASPKCRAALENLRAIYDALCACGFEDFVTIDLGMVHAIGYYTGMIFRGISASFGQPLLSGGRYDGCCATSAGRWARWASPWGWSTSWRRWTVRPTRPARPTRLQRPRRWTRCWSWAGRRLPRLGAMRKRSARRARP